MTVPAEPANGSGHDNRERDLRFSSDPEALAWARDRVQHEIDRMRKFEQQAADRGDDGKDWRRHRWLLESMFIGGEGCTIAAFDVRWPRFADAVYGDQP